MAQFWNIIGKIGVIASLLMTLITLLGVIVKPVRTRFIKWVTRFQRVEEKYNIVEEQEKTLKLISGKVDGIAETVTLMKDGDVAVLRHSILSLCSSTLHKGEITSVEKMDLMDMYASYHALGGDTYCTARYELALELPEV